MCTEAAALASWWCLTTILRGPALQRFGMGQRTPGSQSVGEWLTFRRASDARQQVSAASFWLCVLNLAFPGNVLLFAAATGTSFVQQLMSLRVIKFGSAVR